MAAESEFVRPELTFEREFGQFRNWWTRDRRVVGNPLSIYLYLLSHRRDYTITQARAQRDLGLGKDAFLAARRRLESAGYLSAETMRWPAGATDDTGRKVGGQPRKLVFHVLDPARDASCAGDAEEEKPVAGRATSAGEAASVIRRPGATPASARSSRTRLGQCRVRSSSADGSTLRTTPTVAENRTISPLRQSLPTEG